MVKIYFDARWVGKHGIGRFAKEIDSSFEFERANLSGRPSSAFDPFRLFFFIMLKVRFDSFFFSPGFNVPLIFSSKYICTIHDLNHIDVPFNSTFIKRFYYNFFLKSFIKKTIMIITVSEYTKKRLIDWAGISESKIVVVGNGVNSNFNILGEKYTPGYRYILCISNRKPHKNENRVVEAFSLARVDSDVRLVFTGKPSNQLLSKIHKLNLLDRVVFLGSVNEVDLPKIYRGALFLCFPSLYEGFGLPVIEAMACGIPVITSNITALPEISNGAAYLVDPYDVSAISEAIELLHFDQVLRNILILKGIEQAKKYNWPEVMEGIDAAFKCKLSISLPVK